MNELVWSGTLWARVGWFDSMTRQFSSGSFRFGPSHLLVLTLLAFGVAGIYWYAKRSGRAADEPRYDNPRALFRALCRAHGLDRANRRLLDQLARHQRLTDPARLFLEPERFELANLGPALKPQQTRFATLRDRLFAETGTSPREASSDRRRASTGPTPARKP